MMKKKRSIHRTAISKRILCALFIGIFTLSGFTTIAGARMRSRDNAPVKAGGQDTTPGGVDQILQDLNHFFQKLLPGSKGTTETSSSAVQSKGAEDKALSTLFQQRLQDILTDKKRIDTGDGFVNEIIKDNDRMYYYDLYIKLAKAKGYIVTSYIDYLEHYKGTDKKVLILRHDIDDAGPGTQIMFDIERKEGVKATYYFRWCTFDLNLINEIHNAGFEVGLHYETIANYCEDHHTRKIGSAEIAICRENLKTEIKDFKEKTGINIQTISSHGNPINREIHMPNNVLLQGQNYSDYGIVSETYDREILKNEIKSYICDNDLLKNDGFSYRANPIDSIMQNKQVIEFLSHPTHWYYTAYQRSQMHLAISNMGHKNKA